MVCKTLSSMKIELARRVMAALMILLLGAATFSAPAEARLRGGANQRTTGSTVSNVLQLNAVQVNPDGSGITFTVNRPFTVDDTRYLTVLKLPNPNRLVIDIPNARLGSVGGVVPVQRAGIQHVELSQNSTSYYSAVRAIVFVNDIATLNRIQTAFAGNGLRLDSATPQLAQQVNVPTNAGAPRSYTRPNPLPPTPGPNPSILSPTPAGASAAGSLLSNAAGLAVIEDVGMKEEALRIKADRDLKVKSRFTLSAPNRLVIDFEEATLASRALLNPVPVTSAAIRQIRLGQFDDRTVRLVIETPNPDAFEVVSSGTAHELSISPYSGTSITKMANSSALGYVDQVALRREGGGTVVRLSSTVPMVHRFQKKDGRVQLELLNLAASPALVNFDAKLYPELKRMRFDALTATEPNSQFLVDLADPENRVVTSLSDDKKTIELLITSSVAQQDDGGPVPTITNASLGSLLGGNGGGTPGPAGKAPYPARIVLDAGHGGKDAGAMRSGVKEKDLNLSLALMVKDALEAKGFQVTMTRNTDVFLPLPTITAITNQNHPDLFVSIHHNSSEGTVLRGIETYYYTPQSKPLADRIHRREINAVGVRDGGVKKAMFYVIHHTNVPAVLCEVGYVSNPSELADLQTMERKQKTARAIADGVVDYVKSRVSASK